MTAASDNGKSTVEPSLTDLVPIPAVWERLARVEARLYEATRSDNPFLTQIAQHLLGAGKRYRPLLAQVAAELGDDPGSGAVEAGVAVELVHVGSLYHDDVIDEADTRRAASSVNANWSNTLAILAGDFLLARASEVAAPLGEDAVALLAHTYATLCEGQVAELQLEGDMAHGADQYFHVIGSKTASLIRTSARLGAMAGGAGPDAVEAASDWAWEMGIVFQMTDDVLDLVATADYLGKPSGSDIIEGTFTLPVLYTAAGPDGDELRTLLQGGKPYPPEAVARVVTVVKSSGNVDRVLDEAAQRLEVAGKAVARLPRGPVTDVLSQMGQFLLDRVESAR